MQFAAIAVLFTATLAAAMPANVERDTYQNGVRTSPTGDDMGFR